MRHFQYAGNLAEGVTIAKKGVISCESLAAVEGEADLRRQKLIARALYAQGMVGLGVGNIPAVIQALNEAIAISRATGEKLILGYSLEMFFTASTFTHSPVREDAAREGFEDIQPGI